MQVRAPRTLSLSKMHVKSLKKLYSHYSFYYKEINHESGMYKEISPYFARQKQKPKLQ